MKQKISIFKIGDESSKKVPTSKELKEFEKLIKEARNNPPFAEKEIIVDLEEEITIMHEGGK